MILELAILRIHPGQQADFERVFPAAEKVIGRAAGYLGHQLQRGIEDDAKYALLVRWETLEAHTEGFRQGPLFGEWRALIGPFFASPPEVEHFHLVAGS